MSICYKVDHSKKTGTCYLSNPKLFSLKNLLWWLLKLHKRFLKNLPNQVSFDCVVDLLTSLRLKS